MQIIVDQLLTHYERIGEGKLVVIVPGWADTSAQWRPFQRSLSSDYEVIVIDLPGFGGTQAPDSTWGLSEYAGFLGLFLRKLGLKPYALIGHSNGGA